MLEIVSNTVNCPDSALFAFLEKEELSRHLNLFFFGQKQFDSPLDARIRVLKWHQRNRCTMEITLKSDGVFHALIGKTYVLDRPHLYRTMEALVRGGLDHHAPESVPHPLDLNPSLPLSPQLKIPGASVRESFLG